MCQYWGLRFGHTKAGTEEKGWDEGLRPATGMGRNHRNYGSYQLSQAWIGECRLKLGESPRSGGAWRGRSTRQTGPREGQAGLSHLRQGVLWPTLVLGKQTLGQNMAS